MAKDEQTRRVLLGEISGVHGIRGDILVRTYTATPEAIAGYGPLTDATGARAFSLTVVRVTDKGVVARIAGISDRTTAEALRGTKLFVARTRLPETDTSEFYHADLIGLEALAEDGAHLGEIVSVQNFGAGDLLELKPLAGSSEFIPFEDQWVPQIDLMTRTVIIKRPPSTGDENEDAEPGEPDRD
ncbi:16S rRNA-processing protein RimM [Hyphomicrobium denitrificans 1NES1]|uniref:Ribosome maturation factor RimM n=1 Tax=Hyphomicrobium denitrificans 1NES1 TaxID=670307 RepID=N0B7N2_9HYPH|nr:ribosome maturation factor RimM [Hyphomicrobium denitrificans]AGK59649.1 16S rRNA-processing protein RimM [Hyphomicrobium denitrificans 1NES1]